MSNFKKIKTFEKHTPYGGTQYRGFFPNGYGVSIVQHNYSYGGSEGLWELAILKGDKEESTICYDTPITNDVIGYLSESEVDDIVEKVKKLK